MTGLAYVTAFIVFQLGSWFQGTGFTFGTAMALVVAGVMLWLIFRPAPTANSSAKGVRAEAVK